jgi:DNA-binding CsgD family transcriptional regulator
MVLMEIRWLASNIASVPAVAYLPAAVTIEGSTLELVGDAYGLLEIDEFRPGLLSALRRAVPSDWASLNEVGPEPKDTFSIIEPPLEHRWHKAWRAYGDENPLVAYFQRTKDGRPYRFSDLISQDELHSLDLYREFYGPIGLEHQIAFLLPSVSGAILGVALSRREPDFTDAERDLLGLARPHLIQAYNNALRYSGAARAGDEEIRSIPRGRLERLREAGLTGREGEALVLAASGSSDREIAEILGIGHRTVAKHLHRSYVKLGIEGRSQATAFVDELERRPQRPT